LIPALASQIGGDELFVFYNRDGFTGLAQSRKEIVIRGKSRLLWDFVRLPREVKKLSLDAVIFPKNIAPILTGCLSFTVVHDLAYFDRDLNAYPALDTMYMRLMVPNSVRRSTGIFAVSESTKRDIIRYTGCAAAKITVTYEAANKMYRRITESEPLKSVRLRYGLPDEYIMYVGSLSPRKNIIRLFEAFARIRSKVPHKLVLTGSKSWKDSAVLDTINQLGLGHHICKLGYVEPGDMPVLYNLADTFVYPSLYEGFGLPILEAMQCGCPVVASNATSLPEVAGDAALLIDPLDIDALADAIYRALTDNQLRKQLIKSGIIQAEEFSWENTARIMLEKIRQSCKV